jgi:hypothetical protein
MRDLCSRCQERVAESPSPTICELRLDIRDTLEQRIAAQWILGRT